MSVLAVSNASKAFGKVKALDGASFALAQGELLALLGPNGAGKTTLINIVCGIVNATSGSVLVDGHHFAKEYRAARSVLCSPQSRSIRPRNGRSSRARLSRTIRD